MATVNKDLILPMFPGRPFDNTSNNIISSLIVSILSAWGMGGGGGGGGGGERPIKFSKREGVVFSGSPFLEERELLGKRKALQFLHKNKLKSEILNNNKNLYTESFFCFSVS